MNPLPVASRFASRMIFRVAMSAEYLLFLLQDPRRACQVLLNFGCIKSPDFNQLADLTLYHGFHFR